VDYPRLTVEAIGAAVVGGLSAALRYALSQLAEDKVALGFGHTAALGAFPGVGVSARRGILGTAVAPTFEEVRLLATTVVIRTVPNHFPSKVLERDQAPPNPERD
jgi:uncharacterized membrane protein